jgi:hypothetical protein
MAGTTTTPRVAGIPDAGFPSEIDASVKIRWVDDLLVNMSERSADLLKYLGGPSQFAFNNTKVEWVEDDPWNRRPSLGATPLSNAADTSLSLAADTNHRYPVGTILKNLNGADSAGEYVRVIGHGSDTLIVERDLIGDISEGAWATADEVIVSGFAMNENDNWTARPTPIFNLPYNYAQVQHVAVDVTYRRQETALYGLRGTDLDKLAADATAEQFVAMEDAALHGARYAGASATKPAMYGGLVYYITAANGAQVTDLSGAALTRKDIDDKLQDLFYEVGAEKMALTVLASAWGKRKITSFFSAAERLGSGAREAGVAIDRVLTDFGTLDILLHTALGKDELYFIRREQNTIGNYGQRGKPHLEEAVAVVSSNTGPFTRRIFYADLSMMCKGVQGEGRLHNFSITA